MATLLLSHGFLATRPSAPRSRLDASTRTAAFRNMMLEADSAAAQPLIFEAQADPMQFALLLGVVLLPFGYWWYVTVPDARLGLAKDKRKGGMRAYIDNLRADSAPRGPERWFFQKYLRQLPEKALELPRTGDDSQPVPNAEGAGEASERQPSPSLEELLRPASLTGNPTPRFWSGDNPIVVTMGALLSMGAVATAYKYNAALTLDALVLAAGIVFGLSRLSLD